MFSGCYPLNRLKKPPLHADLVHISYIYCARKAALYSPQAVAIGPQQGRKAFMIRTVRPQDRPDPGQERMAKANGFSLHAGVSCEGHQKNVRRQRIWNQSGSFLRDTFLPAASPVSLLTAGCVFSSGSWSWPSPERADPVSRPVFLQRHQLVSRRSATRDIARSCSGEPIP